MNRRNRSRAQPSRKASRVLLFGLLCLAAVVVAGGYTLLTAFGSQSTARRALADPSAAPEAIAVVRQQPHLVFLQTDGDAYRRVGLIPLGALDGPPYLTALQCQRVHFAAGQGLCLGQDYQGGAFTFDADFQPRYSIQTAGIASRARVSPDGRHGSMTVFVTGHSYADGGFSTQTTLVDMASGVTLGDLEQFAIWRHGARFQAPDFNFWGVTFAHDSNRFYATLGSGGKTYLIEGDVAAREARVLRENVECPSLSPDDSRLVFKKRMESSGPGPVAWRLHLLDLATLAETPLPETRSVDDQVEWLDNDHIVYSLPDEGPPSTIRPDLWMLRVDGNEPPHLVRLRTFSPASVH